jgi:PTS system nitrogen regulatory IIA component
MKNYELMTIEEVSKLLRVSERTVYDWAQKGEIPCGKFGTSWRFRKSEILKWIDDHLKSPKKSSPTLAVNLSSILSRERVVFLNETTKEEALTHLAEVLSSAKEVHNPDELLEEIFRREELMSTGIGMGIGIPHVRLNSVDDLVIAVGVCRKPLVDYQSLDNAPVQLLVMIAANTGQHSKHIKTLSAITKILKDDDTRRAILSAPTEEQAYQIFTSGDLND